MKFPLTAQLIDEARRYQLRSACQHCLFWLPARGARVRIAGAEVAVGADGRFAARRAARGFVRVEVDADPDAAMAWEGRARPTVVVVPLTGRGSYALGDLTAGTCGG